jgi:molecular chaperone DnaJ
MDAYQILGVPKNADKATIKAAYRKAIQDWHPDKFGTDEVKKKEGNSRLEKINRAYYILSDEDRRQRYDRYGEQGVGSSASSEEQMENGGGFGFSGFGGDGQDLSSLFQSLFGGLGEDSIGFDINDLGMGGGSIRNKRNAKQQGKITIDMSIVILLIFWFSYQLITLSFLT